MHGHGQTVRMKKEEGRKQSSAASKAWVKATTSGTAREVVGMFVCCRGGRHWALDGSALGVDAGVECALHEQHPLGMAANRSACGSQQPGVAARRSGGGACWHHLCLGAVAPVGVRALTLSAIRTAVLALGAAVQAGASTRGLGAAGTIAAGRAPVLRLPGGAADG